MTDTEILTRAILKASILKASKNGFDIFDTDEPKIKVTRYDNSNTLYALCSGIELSQNEIIFDLQFAKALFGTRLMLVTPDHSEPEWKFHLKQLVVKSDEDRIFYLRRFI